MGTDIMLIAEVKEEEGWVLAFPMERNPYWVDPEGELSLNDGLDPENALYVPVNEYPGYDPDFFESIYRQPACGLPVDLSNELARYFNTYWKDDKGTTWGHGWYAYDAFKQLTAHRFARLEALPQAKDLRLVYWFY